MRERRREEQERRGNGRDRDRRSAKRPGAARCALPDCRRGARLMAHNKRIGIRAGRLLGRRSSDDLREWRQQGARWRLILASMGASAQLYSIAASRYSGSVRQVVQYRSPPRRAHDSGVRRTGYPRSAPDRRWRPTSTAAAPGGDACPLPWATSVGSGIDLVDPSIRESCHSLLGITTDVAMLHSPRRSSNTMRVFSSEKYYLRVTRRMFSTSRSDYDSRVPAFCLISTPWRLL